MSRQIDRRYPGETRATNEREAELAVRAAVVSDQLPGDHRITVTQLDPMTGNATVVTSIAAPALEGNYVQRALDHLHWIGPALGLSESQAAEFVADPHPQFASSGAVAVHLQQLYKGIPVFQATETVRFAPDGALADAVGGSVTIGGDLLARPEVPVEDAVRVAARYVAVPDADELAATDQFGEPLTPPSLDVQTFGPRVVVAFADKPDRPTVLDPGPFGDQITAGLTWFPLGDELRLAWIVHLVMPQNAGDYRVIVDAKSSQILYCRDMVNYVAASGNVCRRDGGGTRQMTDFPLPLASYAPPTPAGLPAGFPYTWVEKDRTVGNCASAYRDASGQSYVGALVNQVVTFNPSNPSGEDQQVLNAFYFSCYMHDYFYLLGFREADGNFQSDNFNLGGAAGDPVHVEVYPGPVSGTASMSTPADGKSPTLKLGLVTSTSRHTALDASLVFHEYTHGVTNRLVGGPLNVLALSDPQSVGMGEGWSDYFACIVNGTVVFGSWVWNTASGRRLYPYDSAYPDDFGDLGQGRYDGRDEHNTGEIWCAALMEMTRNVGGSLPAQLVVDGLKLTPANPSFLQARDAILAALEFMKSKGTIGFNRYLFAKNAIWRAFARFGMGPLAKCTKGTQLTGCVPDYHAGQTTPQEAVAEALLGKVV